MKHKYSIINAMAVILFAFFGIAQAEAQVTFKPGLRTGANFAHFTKGDVYDDDYINVDVDRDYFDFSSKTEFYVGFYGALKLSKFYTLQPEINYSAQGSTSRYRTTDGNYSNRDFNIDYLSIDVVNKFTFGNFNVHVGPTLDFIVSKDFNPETTFDMAFVLGVGYNFTPNIGFEARVKKGIIPVFETIDSYHTNVVFSIGGTYTFDVK